MSKIKCPIEWKPNANAMTMVASVVDKILLQDDIAEFIEKELIDAERGATRGGSSHPSSPRVPPPPRAAVPVAQIVGQAGHVVDVGLTDDEKKQAVARAKKKLKKIFNGLRFITAATPPTNYMALLLTALTIGFICWLIWMLIHTLTASTTSALASSTTLGAVSAETASKSVAKSMLGLKTTPAMSLLIKPIEDVWKKHGKKIARDIAGKLFSYALNMIMEAGGLSPSSPELRQAKNRLEKRALSEIGLSREQPPDYEKGGDVIPEALSANPSIARLQRPLAEAAPAKKFESDKNVPVAKAAAVQSKDHELSELITRAVGAEAAGKQAIEASRNTDLVIEAAAAIGQLFRNVALDLTKQGIDKLPGDGGHTESAAAFKAPSAKKSLKVAGEHLNKVSKELIQNTEVIAIQRALLKACGGKEGTDVLIMMGEFIKNKPDLANDIGRKLLPHFLTETHKKLLDFPAKTFKAIYRFWRKKLVPKSEARLARLAAQKKWRKALTHARAISGIKLEKKAHRVSLDKVLDTINANLKKENLWDKMKSTFGKKTAYSLMNEYKKNIDKSRKAAQVRRAAAQRYMDKVLGAVASRRNLKPLVAATHGVVEARKVLTRKARKIRTKKKWDKATLPMRAVARFKREGRRHAQDREKTKSAREKMRQTEPIGKEIGPDTWSVDAYGGGKYKSKKYRRHTKKRRRKTRRKQRRKRRRSRKRRRRTRR